MAGDTLDLSGALAKLMADPSLLQTIASALGNGQNTVEATSAPPAEDESSEKDRSVVSTSSEKGVSDISGSIGDILPAISKLSALSGNLSSHGKDNSKDTRICLLNALKPYLNPRRCDAIDKLVKFSSLSELMKKL